MMAAAVLAVLVCGPYASCSGIHVPMPSYEICAVAARATADAWRRSGYGVRAECFLERKLVDDEK